MRFTPFQPGLTLCGGSGFSWAVATLLILVPAALAVIVLSVAGAHWVDGKRRRSPRPTCFGLAIWSAFRLYARLWHRTRHVGRSAVEPRPKGPIIIVSNHTGAADPPLIQAGCTFEIRWMMMREMNKGFVDWFTRYGRIILVERDGRDLASTREALRHLRAGGVLGIFPEGGIERPPGQLRRFQEGVGFLVQRTGAAVIPVWVSGTPKVDIAFESLWKPGRARVEFGEPMRFGPAQDPQAITCAIRDRIAAMSGWPISDDPTPAP